MERPVNDKNLILQKDIENAYNKLRDILHNARQDVLRLKGVDSSFNTIKHTIEEALNAQIGLADKELSKALSETVWDNFVVAFFGETGAGKSTIIETFRILFDKDRQKEDGLIVGDGRSDFTKTYEEYRMSIKGCKFTLIDMPGIEGNEDEFKDVIQTALHKAHCIFYIQGHNKKPEEATAKKMKKYLGDWVKVYSVYNVRGDVSSYDEEEERETLLTDGLMKAERLIQTEFKKIFGDVYAGHVTLQALLAMSAKAEFSKQRKDLIKTQQKLIKYFGNSDRIMKFSQFQALINLVEQKASNFKPEIIEANKQKMISLANQSSNKISYVVEEQKDSLNRLKDKLKEVEGEVCGYLDLARMNIQNKSKNAIDRIYGRLKNDVFKLIDDNVMTIEAQVKIIQRDLLDELDTRIRNIVRGELLSASNKAERKIKELDGIRLAPISFRENAGIGSEIDFSGALSELDVSLDDVLEWTGKTAGTAATGALIGSVIPGVGTLIGTVAGGIIGGIAHAFSGDSGRANARKSASDAIEKAKKKTKGDSEKALNPVLEDIEDQKRKLKNAARQGLHSIEELNDSVDSFGNEIEDYVKQLKNNKYGRI